MNLSFRGSRRPLIRILLSGALAAAGLGLAACGGAVGSGNAPRNLVISTASGASQLNTLRMYECLTSRVRALLYFTDNSGGDFTGRVKWSSSNPGAVAVSNGDIPAPGGLGFYGNGVLIPRGSGNAIITAEYFGITSQVAVSVGTPQSINLRAILHGNYLPLSRYNPNRTSNSKTFTLGTGTSMQLAATALLDGVETDISQFATFGFQLPNDGVAIINQPFPPNPALISAVAPGGPLVPVASFAPCTLTNISDPANSVSFTVSPLQDINLRPEFPPADPSKPISDSNPVPQLIVGNTEKFTVLADLANGDQQDVSPQSTLSSSNPAVAQFGGASGINNVLAGVSPGGPVVLSATFNIRGPVFTAPSIVTSTRSLPLITIFTCWSDPLTVFNPSSCKDPSDPAFVPQPNATVTAGTLMPVQYHAIGTYGLDANNQVITQEVTRQTTWSSLNTAVATISNSPVVSGQALGVAQGAVTIQASNAAARNVPQAFNQLNVQPIP